MPEFKPNTTAYPNFLFEVMHTLKESELRVLNVIVRQTYGWHKERDKISLSQMMKFTGLSKQGCLDAREGLIAKNIISTCLVDGMTEYMILEPVQNLDVYTVDPVQIEPQGSLNRLELDVHTVDIQKKEEQNKHTKESNPIDFEFIKSEFTNFFKSKHPNSPPPKIHFITVEQIAKIEGLERHHFLEKMQAYYDNPWRVENKRPFSLEGLYAGWNFIEMPLPVAPLPELGPPPPKREENKQELYERLTQGFSKDTKDQLSAVLKFDGDTLVAFAQTDGRIGVIAKNLLDKINT